MSQEKIMVEIVVKKKGCILCDLAMGNLEEISPGFAGLNCYGVIKMRVGHD